MTHAESMMLAICFGAVMGSFIGNIITLIKSVVEDRRDKKRRRKEKAERQHSEEQQFIRRWRQLRRLII